MYSILYEYSIAKSMTQNRLQTQKRLGLEIGDLISNPMVYQWELVDFLVIDISKLGYTCSYLKKQTSRCQKYCYFFASSDAYLLKKKNKWKKKIQFWNNN